MFTILSHKGNANQSNTEIPSHPSHNGYIQENKQSQTLLRIRGKWDPYT
jgi:hypothetical protein